MPKYIQTESDLIAGDDATLKQLVVEARAKIIWGERSRDVEKWLAIRGVPDSKIKTIIASCTHERSVAIRRLGLRDIAIGSVPLGIGIIVLAGAREREPITYGDQKEMAGAILLAMFGLWMLTRGIQRMVSGANSKGSIPDMK